MSDYEKEVVALCRDLIGLARDSLAHRSEPKKNESGPKWEEMYHELFAEYSKISNALAEAKLKIARLENPGTGFIRLENSRPLFEVKKP